MKKHIIALSLSIIFFGCEHKKSNKSPLCGDGILDPEEQCDNGDLGGQTCETLGYRDGYLKCNYSNCTYDLTDCKLSSFCGDNELQEQYGEECDRTDLNNKTCEDLGYYGGTLGCTRECLFDVTSCEAAGWCGDNIINGINEICDGTDLGETCEPRGFSGGTVVCTDCKLDFSQCEDNVSFRQWGTSYSDYGSAITLDSTGNVYVVGSTSGEMDENLNSGLGDIFLTKFTPKGTKLWTTQWGTSYSDIAHSVAVDKNGNILVAGETWGSFDGNIYQHNSDVFITKLSPDGIKLWTKQWVKEGSNDRGYGIVVDSDNAVYVTGETKNKFQGNSDIFITKLSPEGIELWTKQWGNDRDNRGNGIVVDSDNAIYVTGVAEGGLDGNTSQGFNDIFLTKFLPDGTKLWTLQWGTEGWEAANSAAVDSDGNILVAGYTYGDLEGNTSSGRNDVFLTKVSPDGTKLWTRQWGTYYDDYGYSVAADGNGNIFITGETRGNMDGNTSFSYAGIFLTKITSEGNVEWTRQWGFYNEFLQGAGIAVSDKSTIYITSKTRSEYPGFVNAGGEDAILIIFRNN